jgi:hypothetical protein
VHSSITVTRIRNALVVGEPDTEGAAVRLAATMPAGADRTVVVADDAAVPALRRLDPWVLADLADSVPGDICLVGPDLGAMGEDGALPPARLLADRLGVAVTAADGNPVGLADGSLYVADRTAGWVTYRPGGTREPLGARYPAPTWQDDLPEPTDRLTHVPAGLWLRAEHVPEREDDPLRRRVPDRDRLYLVLGAPGESPPDVASVAEVLRALPVATRDRTVLACFGSTSPACAVADELGAPVRVAHGVPAENGLAVVDDGGVVRWWPFAWESVCSPGLPPVLDRWAAPPGLPMVEPASYRLAPGWRVEVVARGLVVRAEQVGVDPAWRGETGPTPDVVFASDGRVTPEALAAFDRLVDQFPRSTRENLRVLAVDRAAADALAATRVGTRVVPFRAGSLAPTGPVVVTGDGRILPSAPILAVPPARKDSVVALLPAPPAAEDSVVSLLPGKPRPVAVEPVVPTVVEVPENIRGTAEQRRAMRDRFGSRYDQAVRVVTKLLSERPGLRFGSQDRAALLTELAVVRMFADDPLAQYDTDFHVCLADGLRRLPTVRTVVVRGIPADTQARPQDVLRLPAPVVAALGSAGPVGPAEALIWTTTARRLDGLITPPAADDAPGQVVLAGHTRLRVLAVEEVPVRRILLAEDGAAPEAALTRLRAIAAARAAAAKDTAKDTAHDAAPDTAREATDFTDDTVGPWFGPLPAA